MRPRRPQAQGRRMPQAPGRTMPQAPGSTMPQAPTGQPVPGEMIFGQRGQQSGGGGFDPRMEDDTPKRDPRMPEFSLTGMQAAYEKSQQPGGGFSNQEQYRRGPERYVEEPMISRGMMAKGGSIKAKKGGSVKSKSASSRGDGCAQRGKTRGKMV